MTNEDSITELLAAIAQAERLMAGKARELRGDRADALEVEYDLSVGETTLDGLPDPAREELVAHGVQLGIHIQGYIDAEIEEGTAWTWVIERARAVVVDQYRIELLGRLGCSRLVAVRVGRILG